MGTVFLHYPRAWGSSSRLTQGGAVSDFSETFLSLPLHLSSPAMEPRVPHMLSENFTPKPHHCPLAHFLSLLSGHGGDGDMVVTPRFSFGSSGLDLEVQELTLSL